MSTEKQRQKLIEGLNYDLAGELSAIMQYMQHSFIMLGFNRLPLSELREKHAKDEMNHTEMLAERIVGMGGIPTVKPRPIMQGKTIEEMHCLDLEAEKQALKDYIERRNYAEKIGEVGTALIIENIIVDEQKHYDDLVKLLRENK